MYFVPVKELVFTVKHISHQFLRINPNTNIILLWNDNENKR